MSEATPIIVTIEEVREAARKVVNHKSTRGALGVSTLHVWALAHAFCALDDIARLSAELFRTRDAMAAAGRAGDFKAEHCADDRLDEIEVELTDALVALGFNAHHQAAQEAKDGQ